MLTLTYGCTTYYGAPLLPLVVLERLGVQVLLGLPRVLLVREALPLDQHPAVRALPHLAQQRLDLVVAVALRVVVGIHDPNLLPRLANRRRRRRVRGRGSGGWLVGAALAPRGGQAFGLSVCDLDGGGGGPLPERRLVSVVVGVRARLRVRIRARARARASGQWSGSGFEVGVGVGGRVRVGAGASPQWSSACCRRASRCARERWRWAAARTAR